MLTFSDYICLGQPQSIRSPLELAAPARILKTSVSTAHLARLADRLAAAYRDELKLADRRAGYISVLNRHLSSAKVGWRFCIIVGALHVLAIIYLHRFEIFVERMIRPAILVESGFVPLTVVNRLLDEFFKLLECQVCDTPDERFVLR